MYVYIADPLWWHSRLQSCDLEPSPKAWSPDCAACSLPADLSCMQKCWHHLPRWLARVTPCQLYISRPVPRHVPAPATHLSSKLPSAETWLFRKQPSTAQTLKTVAPCRAASAQADSPAGAFTTATLRTEVQPSSCGYVEQTFMRLSLTKSPLPADIRAIS